MLLYMSNCTELQTFLELPIRNLENFNLAPK